MSLLLIDSVTKDLGPWAEAFRKELGEDQVILFDQMDDPSKVSTAVVWNHRSDLFDRIPDVKLVASLGAGVDHILSDPKLPKGAKVSRIISPILSEPMSNYCIGAVLYYKKQFDKYAGDKLNRKWEQEFDPERSIRVGILGLGELGGDLASKLVPLGFEVSGMSQSRKEIKGVKSYVMEEMDEFLAEINLLICMLPATPETKNILSKDLFDRLPKGSFLINVARGHHQVDEDILAALDSGQLAGAFLDVFPSEPLPKESRLWDHPKVFITPHIAVVTKPDAAIPQIVANHRSTVNGGELTGLVDRQKGY